MPAPQHSGINTMHHAFCAIGARVLALCLALIVGVLVCARYRAINSPDPTTRYTGRIDLYMRLEYLLAYPIGLSGFEPDMAEDIACKLAGQIMTTLTQRGILSPFSEDDKARISGG